jgi:hypothetical protein
MEKLVFKAYWTGAILGLVLGAGNGVLLGYGIWGS